MDSLKEKLADLRSRLHRLQEFKRRAGDDTQTMPPDLEDDFKQQIAEVLKLMAERNSR